MSESASGRQLRFRMNRGWARIGLRMDSPVWSELGGLTRGCRAPGSSAAASAILAPELALGAVKRANCRRSHRPLHLRVASKERVGDPPALGDGLSDRPDLRPGESRQRYLVTRVVAVDWLLPGCVSGSALVMLAVSMIFDPAAAVARTVIRTLNS